MSIPSSVFIIGQGIAGLACAYRFVKAGFRVTIIGPQNKEGSASSAAVGVSTLKGQTEPRTPLFSAKLYGHHNLKKWIEEIEVDARCLIPHDFSGVLEPFQNFNDYVTISSRVFKEQFRGNLDYQFLNRDDMKSLGLNVRILHKNVWGAFYYPDGFSFSVPSLLGALKTFLVNRGVLFEEEPLLKIEPSSNEGLSLQTIGQTYCSKNVILAAGCFSKSILQSSRFFDQNLNSTYGHTKVYPSNEPIICPLVRGAYSLCVHKDEIRMGSSTYRELEPFKRMNGPDKVVLSFGEILWKTCSQMNNSGFVVFGERAQTPDRLPLIGHVEVGPWQLGIATGFDKSGFQLADIAARFHVSRVLRQPQALPNWINAFSCERSI